MMHIYINARKWSHSAQSDVILRYNTPSVKRKETSWWSNFTKCGFQRFKRPVASVPKQRTITFFRCARWDDDDYPWVAKIPWWHSSAALAGIQQHSMTSLQTQTQCTDKKLLRVAMAKESAASLFGATITTTTVTSYFIGNQKSKKSLHCGVLSFSAYYILHSGVEIYWWRNTPCLHY